MEVSGEIVDMKMVNMERLDMEVQGIVHARKHQQLGIQSIFGARSPPGQSWAGTVLRGIPLTLMTIVHHFKRHWKQFEFDNMDVAIWTMVAIPARACKRGLR